MKSIFKKFGENLAAFVANLEKSKNHRPQPIILPMIVMEPENDRMKLQSLYAKVTTKACGIIRK
jgi:hypothetical protein